MIPTIHMLGTGHPWSTVYAVAAADIPESWLLAGGLMVQLHAIMGGLIARPTTDADLLVDFMADRRGIARLRNILASRGFETQPGTLTGYTTRMSAPNGDVVDLLVADHLPKFLGADATISGTPVLSMPGGAQAVERSMQVRLVDDRSDVDAVIRIPDLLGVLILKSAAYSADHAGYGDRHLYDAAMLASLIPGPDAELARLHSNTDRKRIKLLHDKLTEDSPYWNNLDEPHRQDGLDTIETLATW
ncbi:hypothetical protein BMYO_2101 [Bifidobacterium myosotis]|uniref:Nucleotidyl transferase AbiEii/AbiGii toxin family protein n=1 Tax=Bifidobacterium myosotis TaxID=1630166 RepID=A0A261FDD6_9BIFI|nr:hypothetical protein [Bifidobacterium myosotis]OZG57118.1 hypothetical protein BMYO_2101 [Bifidobacterium myosotis]